MLIHFLISREDLFYGDIVVFFSSTAIYLDNTEVDCSYIALTPNFYFYRM